MTFMPYSASEGSLVVKAGSPIKAIGDLKGKSIGVAGGQLDKSWLLLQAAAKKQGLDLVGEAKAVFGAPPLLSLKLESGELDAALLYWPYAARLAAKDYRTIVSVEDLAESLGAKGRIAFAGFVFKDTTPQATLVAFGQAERRTEALMADDPGVWTKLRPLMKAPDEKTFVALKEAFQRGIPHKSRDAEIADAKALYATLARIGGPELVGKALTLPDGLYVDQKVLRLARVHGSSASSCRSPGWCCSGRSSSCCSIPRSCRRPGRCSPSSVAISCTATCSSTSR